jgi:6-phosphogluconolactonase
LCFDEIMKNMRRTTAVLAILLAAPPIVPFAAKTAQAAGSEYFVFFGTYTAEKGQGIYVSRLDTATGKLTVPELAAETLNPSFVALHPNRKFLYAVSEISDFNGQKSGAVSAFALDPKTGKLTFLNKVASGGAGPCHVSVDRTGKDVLVANYGGGSVSVLPIRTGGRLAEASAFVQHTGSGADPGRQAGPHAHSANLAPDNRFVMVTDLGLDKVLVYRFDAAKGLLTANDPPYTKVAPASGPRHFAFHPGGKYAYVINEMKSTVTAFAYDAGRGELKEIQTITTLPADFTGNNTTAEVQVHPSGKFLYGSNRGHNSIAVFSIDPAKGTLTPVEQVSSGGKTPRNFGIDPTGVYLIAAHQNSNNIVVFRIDPNTGRLKVTGQTFELHSPVCVKFLPVK